MVSSSPPLVGFLFGVYFGVNMLHVPNPFKVASLCSDYNIRKIRLSEPKTEIFDAFIDNKDVGFTFGIPNALLKKMLDKSVVENWFNTFVKNYTDNIKFEYIVVGEEGHHNILPTLKVLQSLLKANSIKQARLTTIISYTSLVNTDPPSCGDFNPNIKNNLKVILNFLVEQNLPLMVNLYPFKKYVYDNVGGISIDYATFGKIDDPVHDGPFIYHNLFDAMVDTMYAAIYKVGIAKLNNISIVVGETGWPTHGRGAYTNVVHARKYNKNLIEHITSGKGTPRNPNTYLQGFIRSLFNEDARPNGESRYYGIFKTNFTPIYPLFQGP